MMARHGPDLSSLTRALDEARQRLAAVMSSGPSEEIQRAHDALLATERALAAARGEEHAVPCDDFPPWDIGAPMPHLLTGPSGVALAYHLRGDEPAVAIVRFDRVMSLRVGAPNDEVLGGHPLYGRGLSAYRAHRVVDSRWLSEVQAINSVHRDYDAARWTRYTHYLLAFHDETVECICGGYSAEVLRGISLADACRSALERVMG